MKSLELFDLRLNTKFRDIIIENSNSFMKGYKETYKDSIVTKLTTVERKNCIPSFIKRTLDKNDITFLITEVFDADDCFSKISFKVVPCIPSFMRVIISGEQWIEYEDENTCSLCYNINVASNFGFLINNFIKKSYKKSIEEYVKIAEKYVNGTKKS
tara:strand:+ start:39 stop:509 length:471 start_codon:yes stop_codon:yes gene_type:complete